MNLTKTKIVSTEQMQIENHRIGNETEKEIYTYIKEQLHEANNNNNKIFFDSEPISRDKRTIAANRIR